MALISFYLDVWPNEAPGVTPKPAPHNVVTPVTPENIIGSLQNQVENLASTSRNARAFSNTTAASMRELKAPYRKSRPRSTDYCDARGDDERSRSRAAMISDLSEYYSPSAWPGLIEYFNAEAEKYAPYLRAKNSVAIPKLALVRCADCQHFERDIIGSGIGSCAIDGERTGPRQPALWPRAERRCKDFAGRGRARGSTDHGDLCPECIAASGAIGLPRASGVATRQGRPGGQPTPRRG